MTTIDLKCDDGKIFPVDIKAAKMSTIIQTMLMNINCGTEGTNKKKKDSLSIPNIKSNVLKKVIEWCEEHKSEETAKDDTIQEASKNNDDNKSRQIYELSDWEQQFIKSVNSIDKDGKSMLFDLAIAAKDLDIVSLQNIITMEIAKLMKDKKQEEIRDLFKVRHPDAKPIGPIKNIRLQSSDEKIFSVDVEAAKMSGTIKTMFEDLSIESSDVKGDIKEVLPIPNCDSIVLKKVIDWCEHHKDDIESEKDSDSPKEDVYEMNDWDKEFIQTVNSVNELGQSLIFDLIIAANYLNIPGLNDLAVTEVAKMMRGKSQDEIRDLFKLKNDKLASD